MASVWNGAKMWAVKFNSGSLLFTSALHEVEKDPAFVDYLFAKVFLVLNLFVHTNESWMFDEFAPLSIRIFMYLELLHTPFCAKCSYFFSRLRILYLRELIHQRWWELSFCVEDLNFLVFLLFLLFLLEFEWLTRRERKYA